MIPIERSLVILEQRGFCVDEWSRWHQSHCGTYAEALISLNPSLRLGLLGYTDDDGWFVWQHAIAHDDQFAYDASGRHTLPYTGAWGDLFTTELDQDPADHNFVYEESGDDPEPMNAAIAHIQRHGILEGRYGPT